MSSDIEEKYRGIVSKTGVGELVPKSVLSDRFLHYRITTCANILFFKGGYLDFSHLTELKNIYTTEIYMKKQYKSSITKNHKMKRKYFLMVFP